ncbi:MAG: hypothetical protein NVSMB52_18470 [Chloroflexota bacterium]
MRKSIVAYILALVALAISGNVARAASWSSPAGSPSWRAYDTAAYVVSTLNTVRTNNGRSLPVVLSTTYAVNRYAVWEDLTTRMYVLQFKKDTGLNVGMAVYALGWKVPLSHSRLTDSLGLSRPAYPVENHFRTHPKLLLGSFPGTTPE